MFEMDHHAPAAQAVQKDNVIEMSPFLSDRRFPEIAEIDAYWQGKRAGRVMPARADIDPRGIEGALAHSFILERIAPGMTRLRLAGQIFNDLQGMKVRGMPFGSLFASHYRKEIDELAEAVCAKPGIAQMTLSAERGRGKPLFEGRMTLWPLSDDRGHSTRILGAVSYKGVIGETPRHFQLAGHRLRVLSGQSLLPESQQAVGFAEASAPFAAREPARDTAQTKGVPHLRLVKTDR